MKESTSMERQSYPSTFFSKYEIQVSEIIFDLPNLISKSESLHRFPFSWGSKKRRSDSTPSAFRIRSYSSSSYLHRTCQAETEIERRPKVKPEATSPATPLSFSPSESDEKSKHSLRKSSKKRTREEWLEITEGLIQSKELLKGEIETVRSNYNKLKAFNSELKAKKQELSYCLNKENPHLEMKKSLNGGMGLSLSSVKIEYQKNYQMSLVAHQRPFILNQTAYRSQTSENFEYPFGQMAPQLSPSKGLSRVNYVDPLGIPDLNVSVEESFGMNCYRPLDLKRVNNRYKAALARKRRMIKMKESKSCFAAVKPPSRCG